MDGRAKYFCPSKYMGVQYVELSMTWVANEVRQQQSILRRFSYALNVGLYLALKHASMKLSLSISFRYQSGIFSFEKPLNIHSTINNSGPEQKLSCEEADASSEVAQSRREHNIHQNHVSVKKAWQMLL